MCLMLITAAKRISLPMKILASFICFIISLGFQTYEATAATKKLPNRSLKQLAKNVDLIYPLVWQKTNNSVLAAPKNPPKLSVVVGPDSKIYSKNIQKAFALTMNVFHAAELPRKTVMLVTTGDDYEWAKEEFLKAMGEKADLNNIGYGQSLDGNTITIKRVDPNNDDLLIDPNLSNGGTDAHGFTHVLQWYQLGFGNENHLGVPRWILEGSADFMQMYYLKNADYKNWLLNRNAKSLKQHSLQFLNDYLQYIPLDEVPENESPWFKTNEYPTEWAYEIGSYVCDVLVALKGPSSLIKIYRDYVETKNFDKSFNNIYGMPWSEAKPYVAQILYKLARR